MKPVCIPNIMFTPAGQAGGPCSRLWGRWVYGPRDLGSGEGINHEPIIKSRTMSFMWNILFALMKNPQAGGLGSLRGCRW